VKERADKVLVEKGYVSSRSQAKSLIEQGHVLINHKIIHKAGEMISSDSSIEVRTELYVGRGAIKILKALEEFHINVENKIFLDIGASTGGFTEVLLAHKARKVYSIDVGHGQLAAKLRNDDRVINMEGTNIKDLTQLPELADGAVMDLSFISITKVLNSVSRLLYPGAPLVALIKPQFEAGLERLPKDGVVKDPKVHQAILKEIELFTQASSWNLDRIIDSPIPGKSGNLEFLGLFFNK
jgi:23S rRNA (cytidine1920-2'-O)/16S rRNA (cytidine1409-2'-O)-methyltransferase